MPRVSPRPELVCSQVRPYFTVSLEAERGLGLCYLSDGTSMDVLHYYDSDLKLLLLRCFSFALFQFVHTCRDSTSIHEQLLIRADPCITAVVWYEVAKTNKTTE